MPCSGTRVSIVEALGSSQTEAAANRAGGKGFCCIIDERIHLQMGQEEATAARRVHEVDQYHLHEEWESALRCELGEIQFEEELSLQTQQQLNHWEQEEVAAVTARMRAAERGTLTGQLCNRNPDLLRGTEPKIVLPPDCANTSGVFTYCRKATV